ncbi:hypothetical protein Bca52824_065464 [Brassica carinata]|uniref:Uncharacterized protein n=1 Tax=Brassica carinata TaxID=52824 RepID=A0A8X7QP49_BRACI|nr:hypothetical protein Bca52824_065464 [Brassica carinata]
MCEFSNICGLTGDGVLSFIVEAEERRTNLRLRDEQDAAYRASLERGKLLRQRGNENKKRRLRREPSVKLQREKLIE